ncbi:MAG: dTMP kinase [Candidatus Micrarchaeota archaeon]|nr:dTMP kinase [Candidatus Micrarchaeota archaeon]
MKNVVICFEGIDGSGKHTQVNLLSGKLAERGIKSRVFSYPDYKSGYGVIVKKYLEGKIEMGVDELFLVFLAEKVRDNAIIGKAMADGEVVILDRYFYSAIAYQCAAGFDYGIAKRILEMIKWHRPSVVFYLDVTPEMSQERKRKQKHELDKHEVDRPYLQKVREYYLRLMREGYSGVDWVGLDGSASKNEIGKSVLSYLEKKGLLP